MISRLDPIYSSLGRFIAVTAEAWMQNGLVKPNSYGVQVLAAVEPLKGFEDRVPYQIGYTYRGAEHNQGWYLDNAHGKNLICLATGMDSHEAIRLWPGLVAQIEGAYPWGGAVIDLHYGLIVGTSGFNEDEDILFSRTVRNFAVILLDRLGEAHLNDARTHGEDDAFDPSDRFTRTILSRLEQR